MAASRRSPESGGRPASVSDQARQRFDTLVARRAAREPLQYVIGQWGFRTLNLMLDTRVLIPRPETEQVVEAALLELDRLADGSPPPGRRPRDRLIARRSRDGLGGHGAGPRGRAGPGRGVGDGRLGGRPGGRRGQSGPDSGGRSAPGSTWRKVRGGRRCRATFVVASIWWCPTRPTSPSAEMSHLDAEVVGWEPRLALEAGPTGLEAIGEILGEARSWLRPTGVAVIEIAPHQAVQAETLARAAGFAAVEVRPDLAGRDRILVARLTPPAAPGKRTP